MEVEIPEDLRPYVAYLPPIVIAEVFSDALRQKIFGHPESKAATVDDIKRLLETTNVSTIKPEAPKPPSIVFKTAEKQQEIVVSTGDDEMDFLADIMR